MLLDFFDLEDCPEDETSSVVEAPLEYVTSDSINNKKKVTRVVRSLA